MHVRLFEVKRVVTGDSASAAEEGGGGWGQGVDGVGWCRRVYGTLPLVKMQTCSTVIVD